jgi:hypothetical protein
MVQFPWRSGPTTDRWVFQAAQSAGQRPKAFIWKLRGGPASYRELVKFISQGRNYYTLMMLRGEVCHNSVVHMVRRQDNVLPWEDPFGMGWRRCSTAPAGLMPIGWREIKVHRDAQEWQALLNTVQSCLRSFKISPKLLPDGPNAVRQWKQDISYPCWDPEGNLQIAEPTKANFANIINPVHGMIIIGPRLDPLTVIRQQGQGLEVYEWEVPPLWRWGDLAWESWSSTFRPLDDGSDPYRRFWPKKPPTPTEFDRMTGSPKHILVLHVSDPFTLRIAAHALPLTAEWPKRDENRTITKEFLRWDDKKVDFRIGHW